MFLHGMFIEIYCLTALDFCQQNQGLQVHAWVLMPNHFHMICSFKNENPGMVLKNIKSFTALKLIDANWRKYGIKKFRDLAQVFPLDNILNFIIIIVSSGTTCACIPIHYMSPNAIALDIS